MTDLHKIIEIGIPGKFDPVFGLMRYNHDLLSKSHYVIVWKETGIRVNSFIFLSPIIAEHWVQMHRESIINRKFEEMFLLNE